MIKIFYFGTLGFFWLLSLLSVKSASAATLEDFTKLRAGSLVELLDSILKAIPIFLAPLALIAIIWSGVLYLTSMGDAAKAEQAKKNLTWAVIGLILVIGFWAILNFVVGGLV